VPSASDLPARVCGVLAVLFLVFKEGYLATGPDPNPVRHDLTAEAIRLARLIRTLLPEDGETAGLLALMLLTEARRTARVSASGELIPLDEQDRGGWDAALIAEGHRLVRERLAAGVAPAATRSSPRSAPCTPAPATYATPTGRRSSRSTISSSGSTLADHCPQPGHRGRRA
jgi:predicted RNA polymerase sigma factor